MEENLEVAGRVIGMMGSRDTKKIGNVCSYWIQS